MRCANKIKAGSMRARCYLEHGHEGVCRTYEGKPFTPTETLEDRVAQRMESTLAAKVPQRAGRVIPRVFGNDGLAIALRKVR